MGSTFSTFVKQNTKYHFKSSNTNLTTNITINYIVVVRPKPRRRKSALQVKTSGIQIQSDTKPEGQTYLSYKPKRENYRSVWIGFIIVAAQHPVMLLASAAGTIITKVMTELLYYTQATTFVNLLSPHKKDQ